VDGVIIREVQPADGPGLARAWEDAREYYAGLDGLAFNGADPADAGLRGWLISDLETAAGHDDFFVRAAATQADDAVGFIVARLEDPVPDAARQLIADLAFRRAAIDALWIRRSHWRHGVGRALVTAAETWAAKHGARSIRLTTYAGSPVSVPFYDALGYERRSIVFLKYLDDR